jgi:hypothetical protein
MIVELLYLLIAFITLVGFFTRIKQTGTIHKMDDDDIIFGGVIIALFWPIAIPVYSAWMFSEWLSDVGE